MKKVFVVGAAGGVGTHLVRRLAEEGITPVGVCRRDEQVQSIEAAGGVAVKVDLQQVDVNTLVEPMKDCDAVVFSAGAGGKGGRAMIDAIDRDAALKTIEAAEQVGIRRVLMVSAMSPDTEAVPDFSEDFRYYFVAKRFIDSTLAARDLDWIILRPGQLTDAPASGKVSAGQALGHGAIARADVAEFIVRSLKASLRWQVIELTQGQTSIGEAIAALPRTSL